MSKAEPLPSNPDVEILSDATVWNGKFPVQQIRFKNRRFDGEMSGVRTWELWRRGRAAALLPYDPITDAVVLIEQFRLPALAAGLDPVLVEIPAGLAENHENMGATLIRETEEEIGIKPRRLMRIGEFLLTAGGSDEFVHISLGEVDAPSASKDGVVGLAGVATEEEDIRIRVWPADRAIETAIDGQFANSVTTIALLWLAAKRASIREQWKILE